MRTVLLLLLLCTILFGCAKQPPMNPKEAPGPVTFSAPEEPILNLAWRSAQLFQTGLQELQLPATMAVLPIANSGGLPPDAVSYFQAVLETRLQASGIEMPGDAPLHMKGSLYFLRDELVFAFQVLNNKDNVLFSDSATVPRDERLQKTLARFGSTAAEPQHAQHEHKEGPIPTPVAQLEQAPLDIAELCNHRDAPCELAILYADRLEILNWTNLARRVKPFVSQDFAPVRSRAPSGKILKSGDNYVVLSNNLRAPLVFDADFNGPINASAPVLPMAAAGLNYFTLGDGRFFDFEPLQPGMAVIETTRRLSIAREGTLSSSSEQAGASLAVHWPVIYTSAPVPAGDNDSVQKFTFSNQSLQFTATRQTQGEILDLAVTDLNHDNAAELLVTVRKPEGVFVEVWEAF